MREWYFIHCSDPHLGYAPNGVWNNRVLTAQSFEIFKTFLSDIQNTDIKFIIISGDISSYDNQDAFNKLISVFDSTKHKIILTGGNHDFISANHKKEFFKILTRYCGVSSLPFSFICNGILFCNLGITCFLSTSYSNKPCNNDSEVLEKDNNKITQWVITPDELEWLKNIIRNTDERIIFINIHTPILPVPERCKFPGFKDSGTLFNADEVKLLLNSFVGKHFIVLSGHTHTNYITTFNNITQIVTSSLCEFPCEYRLIKINQHSIEVETCGLSNPEFAKNSLIEGKELTKGRKEDRKLSIPIKNI